MSQQKEIGTLVVVVLKAQHLHQPSFYKQNPYAQVSLSGLKKRTKADPKGGQHPVWDDEHRFPVLADAGKERVNRILEVSCYKAEQRGDDVFLGKGTVDIEETLKTGEFDDWVSLQTETAGVRGEIYLEMTFYANCPPPLTRRPSKLSPSDRLAHPAPYHSQGRQSSPTSTSPSPQRERSPAERQPGQPPPAGVNRIPSSLIPARGQASRQAPSNGGATPATAVKHKNDSLPPLPANDSPDVDSGKNSGLPAALHPGGRSGPRPMPPQNRTRVTSMDRPPPEALPEQLHRRTLSDAPTLAPFSQLQAPMQAYSSETRSATGASIGPMPSVVVREHVEDHPSPAFAAAFTSPPGHTPEHGPRGVYAEGNYDSFMLGPPSQAYMQPNTQGYIPAPTQGYPQTFPPSQRPMLPQSPHIPLGQPQQLFNVSPTTTSPPLPFQQYNQYSREVATPQSLPSQVYPQLHNSTQPPQQQAPYLSQTRQHPPFQQQPYTPLQQQQYLTPPQQQQHHPQHLPYTQTPHPPNVPQPSQQLSHSQAQPQQSHLTVPPPPPLQSQTPQSSTPQPIHQLPFYFSPPPPPPPPPPPQLYNQVSKGSSPVSVVEPSQTPVSPSAPSQEQIRPPTSFVQSVALVPTLYQSPTPISSLSPVISNNGSTDIEEVGQRQVEEGNNEARSAAAVEVSTPIREDMGGTLQGTARITNEEQSENLIKEEQGQLKRLEDAEAQGLHEGKESSHRVEDIGERCDEEGSRRRQEEEQQQLECRICEEEECKRRKDEEHRKKEDEERRKRDEEELKKKECREREEEGRRKREEEEYRKQEEERRREEERGRQEEEELRRKEEEQRRRREEEELRRREEEQRRKREEELRRKEEEQRRRREEEELKRREEEERRKREEEELRRREEEDRRKREEERQRREEEHRRQAEEAARRRAEEAEAERRWQEELVRIRARAEQEAADAAFARAQMEAEEAERRRQEEEDLALVQQAQEEAEREERLVQEKRRQEEADMEVARREQAHEEELERRRQEERRRRMEEADRELARRLDMELNLGTEYSEDQSQQRGGLRSGRR